MGCKRLMRGKKNLVSTDDRGTRAANECRAPLGLSSAQETMEGDSKMRSEKETQDDQNEEDEILEVKMRR
jgi:hypothetical protein